MARGRKKGGKRESKGEMPLPSEEEGTILCVVTRNLGGGFLEVLCTDGNVYKARIPGKMRRRVWMREGDVVLFLPWGTSDNKGEVVYRYLRDEVRTLIEKGLITEEFLEEVVE
ncbi:MAG: translation initiation factor aIF-1A [Desulfurococcales archaeon]|nr:translation initiation factor aIF-1A [Desulfurococcales archaeon]